MRMQFLKDTAGTFETYVFKDNRKIIPTSATLTVYKPALSTKLIDAAAMTVGADGLLSYGLSAANNVHVSGLPLTGNAYKASSDYARPSAYNSYKAVVEYVYNSVTYSTVSYYDVVISKLTKVIVDDDIVNELPQLKNNGWKVHGTADSGSTTTIIDAELKRYEDNYFTGGLAHSLTRDEVREITAFVSSTGTVTTTAFTGAIAMDKYALTRSYAKEIQRAFEKIEELLIRTEKRPYLILDPYDLKEVHLYYSVAEVCKGLTTTGSDGFWYQMWKDYEAKAYAIFKSINFKYDASDDGVITGAEVGKSMNTRRIGRN